MSKPRVNTMEELSLAIGVSRPTLSRYFQDPSRIKASTVARIEAELGKVDYVPNFFATRLNRKSTGIIGVIIPYLNDLFFTKLLEEIEMAAMDAGYTVITQCSHSDPEIEARAVRTFLSMNVDGALVAPLGNQSDADVHQRLRERLPFVLVDSRPKTMPDVEYVGTDIVDERWHFEAHGEAVLDDYFSRGLYMDRSILCANDRVAIGALRAAMRHGLTPGRDREGGLRIAGHDDYPLCPFTTPSLTTVEQDFEAIGKAAVSRLVELINGTEIDPDNPQVQLFQGSLKLRESA